jgi:type IV secretion system protein VirB10
MRRFRAAHLAEMDEVGQEVRQQVGQVGVEVTRRNLNIRPAIVVRPGYRFFVRVEKDLLFRPPL